MTDASSSKVPIVECVTASWRFFLENWRRFLPAAFLVSLAPALASLALGGDTLAAVYAGLLITTLASILFNAAVLRFAVRNEFNPPTGLGFGADESRLVGVFASTTLVFLPFFLAILIAWAGSLIRGLGLTPEQLEAKTQDQAAFNQMMMDAMKNPPDVTVEVVGLIVGVVLLYLFVRLSISNPATVGERKFVLFQSWSWSKGNVLHIFAAMFITVLVPTLVNLTIGVMLAGDAPGAGVGGLAVNAVSDTVRGLIANLSNIPFLALTAHLYKGLRPPDFVAK